MRRNGYENYNKLRRNTIHGTTGDPGLVPVWLQQRYCLVPRNSPLRRTLEHCKCKRC